MVSYKILLGAEHVSYLTSLAVALAGSFAGFWRDRPGCGGEILDCEPSLLIIAEPSVFITFRVPSG